MLTASSTRSTRLVLELYSRGVVFCGWGSRLGPVLFSISQPDNQDSPTCGLNLWWLSGSQQLVNDRPLHHFQIRLVLLEVSSMHFISCMESSDGLLDNNFWGIWGDHILYKTIECSKKSIQIIDLKITYERRRVSPITLSMFNVSHSARAVVLYIP